MSRPWRTAWAPARRHSLIETAKPYHVDSQVWLADVLPRLPDYPAKRVDELIHWQASWLTTVLARRLSSPAPRAADNANAILGS